MQQTHDPTAPLYLELGRVCHVHTAAAGNAASSLTLFLIEIWERQEKRALPQHAPGI